MSIRLRSLHRLAIAATVALAACGEDSGVVDPLTPTTGAITIASLSCQESGVNADPFTVTKALASKKADHEVASDYTWNAATATTIALNGTAIAVTGSGATANGSVVTISSAGTYVLSGTLADGQVVVSTSDTGVVKLVLNGINVTNAGNTALFVNKAARAAIILADGSTNRVTDGTTYPAGSDPNAAIYSKANLSIGGAGALTVTGRYLDGITGKDGLVIAGGNITVNAVDDGIRGKDYLVIRGGSFSITSGGDGLKSDEEDDTTLGYVLVRSGTFNITSASDAIQAETDALIAGGTFTLKAAGGAGVTISDTLSAKGVKGGVGVVIDGGTFTIDAADDGLHSNGTLVVNGGTIGIATGDDGVHADAALTINGGSINVTRSYEGIENTLADMTFNGGTVRVVSTDDGINLAGNGDSPPGQGGTSTYTMRINGGRIVSTSGGDGVDANGSIAMSGGCVIVHGPTVNNNAPVDYDGTFRMTGGFLVAAGSSGMAQAPGSTSTQGTVLMTFGSTQPAGTLVHIQSAAGAAVLDFTPSKAFSSIALSSPLLQSGSTYSLYTGGTATSTATDGVYESGTYTAGNLVRSFSLASLVSRISF